ncbi:MAG: Spy/CpxP family protein refolding chaperone [Bradyrhizobiaceae bacterium]|nr:Spy/CpxP family protein refolding chaperone [Bradyrhizobiaceae bacterium]
MRDLRATHPDANTLRQVRTQNAQQIRDLHQQFRDRRLGRQNPPAQTGALRANGRPRVTPDSARQGRFASRFQQGHPPRWRVDHTRAQLAWRRHHHAGFVAWRGALFWPYAYTDLFYYPFWPDAYDDGYWPYVYDNFLDSVYWAGGNPYSPYPYAAPTAASVVQQAGTSPGDGAVNCGSGGDLTAWPFAKMASVLQPTPEQQAYLDELKAAAAKAGDIMKASCPQAAALTPTGRLDAMLMRLQGTADAVRTVQGPLMKLYDSLTDEQKARFNAMGPNAGPKSSVAQVADVNACSGQKPGLTDLPIERIEDTLQPSDAQQARLSELSKANDQAIAVLEAACPDSVPQTPVGRLQAIEQRLDAMIQAGKALRPALQAFYDSLTDEQKSRFNTLGQQTAG